MTMFAAPSTSTKEDRPHADPTADGKTRLRQAQAEAMPPIDFLSCLVSDELTRRGDRLLERRTKQAEFRDPQRSLDNFDFHFNQKMNRSLVFDLAAGAFIARHEDALFLGPPGTGKS